MKRIAVVGAGMSGVAAGHFLMKRGYEPELLEAQPSLGGRAGSTKLGDRTIDIGGKNIGRRYHRFRAFLADYGSPPLEYFGINSSTIRDGRLHTIDSTKKLASLLQVLRLVGLKDFIHLLRLFWLVRRAPEEGMLGGPRFSALAEQKDDRPLTAWFGQRTCSGFLRAITLRMNGAEPDEYFYGCLGSNLKMVLDSYDQLCAGVSDLLDRFARQVNVSLGTRVVELIWSANRVVGLVIERDGKQERRFYDGVVLALPAPLSARLLVTEPIRPVLDRIAYHPVSLIVARYNRPIFKPEVRAIVFGEDSPVSNAGCYGPNDLDLVRYTLSGRAAASINAGSDPNEVLSVAESRLNQFVPVGVKDRADFVFRHFQQGLCAYGPYHHRVLAQLSQWESTTEGLWLTGDYWRGASIEACFESAFQCVERLTARSECAKVSSVHAQPETAVEFRTAL